MSFLVDYVGPFLLMLGALVLVHEVGHFWMAKYFRVKVERFSVGFGPSILRRKIGETEYVLAWFLLGGYVKMLGDNPDDEIGEEERKHSFNGQSPWRRIGIALGGPAMNMALPIVLIACLLMAGWPTPTSLIGSVPPDTPAERAGLRPGDRIVSVDGEEVWRWRELRTAIQASDGRALQFGVERAGELLQISIVPEPISPGGPLRIGIEQARAGAVLGVFETEGAAARAGLRTGDTVVRLNGQPVVDWYGFVRDLEAASGTLSLEIARPLQGETERVILKVAGRASGAWSLERLGVAQIETSIARVDVMSPARRSGIQEDDLVVAVNGVSVGSAEELDARLLESGGDPLVVGVLRGGEMLELELKPEQRKKSVDGIMQTVYAVGWYLGVPRTEGEVRDDVVRNPLLALWHGTERTAGVFVGTIDALVKLITRKVGVENLAGPIGIGEIAGDSFKEGWFSFLTVMCVISVNLAILNLLPIPILDGGHIIFSLTELVQGGPVGTRAREIAQTVGISLIVLLMGFAFWNDLSRQWQGILGFLSGLV